MDDLKVTLRGKEVKESYLKWFLVELVRQFKKDKNVRELIHQFNLVIDKPECPSCGRDTQSEWDLCLFCGRVLKEEIKVTFRQNMTIRLIREHHVPSITEDGEDHVVPALIIGSRIYHFGEDGFSIEE